MTSVVSHQNGSAHIVAMVNQPNRCSTFALGVNMYGTSIQVEESTALCSLKKMTLLDYNFESVLCIETSHYVCFTRIMEPSRDEWVFFDSMAFERPGNCVYRNYYFSILHVVEPVE